VKEKRRDRGRRGGKGPSEREGEGVEEEAGFTRNWRCLGRMFFFVRNKKWVAFGPSYSCPAPQPMGKQDGSLFFHRAEKPRRCLSLRW
jgi:hypothetical protein